MNAQDDFRILLVEDQVRHQQIYARALTENLRATVSFATDGEEAIAAMRVDDPPDMVILDLEIPKARGEEILKFIKTDYKLRYTPVIILTGEAALDVQMRLLDQGADDFIEKGVPPEIIIARVRAQMRHKLAVDRLERMALDRDLFAAGVLQDIGSIKGTLIGLCRNARELLQKDLVSHLAELRATLDKLTAHGARLGSYASDVIQSVRETHRAPALEAQDFGSLCDWAVDVSTSTAGTETAIRIEWQAQQPLKPVLADKSFLRLAVLNIVQHAVKSRRDDTGEVRLDLSQKEHAHPDNPHGRRYVTTQVRDHGQDLSDKQLADIFRPTVRQNGADEEFSIGLALVAKVMAKMGGRVWAERPASGHGTVMCLDLPVADAHST